MSNNTSSNEILEQDFQTEIEKQIAAIREKKKLKAQEEPSQATKVEKIEETLVKAEANSRAEPGPGQGAESTVVYDKPSYATTPTGKIEKFEKYEFDDGFEQAALAFLVRDIKFYLHNKFLVKQIYFENDLRRNVFERASKYMDKYNEAPTKEILRNEITKMYHEKKKKDTDIEDYWELLDTLFQKDLTKGEQYSEDMMLNFARNREMKLAVLDAQDRIMTNKDLQPILTTVTKALAVGQAPTDEGGMDMIKMITETFSEDEYIIEPFMKPGEKGYLTAGYKVGKTMMVLQLLLSLAQGVPFLGFKVPKLRRVLYVRFELTDKEIQRRLKLMLHGMHSEILQPSIFIGPKKGFDLTSKDRADLEWTFRMIDKHEPEVLTFDPLYKLTTFNLADPKCAVPLLGAFAEIQKRYPSLHVLTAHHMIKTAGKDKDPDSWDSTYGPMQFFADMDYEMRLRRMGDKEDERFKFDFLTNATPVDKMELKRDSGSLLYEVTKESKSQKKEHRDSEDSEAMQSLLKAECEKSPEGYLPKSVLEKLCKAKSGIGRELFNRLCKEGDGIYWTVKVIKGQGNPVVLSPVEKSL